VVDSAGKAVPSVDVFFVPVDHGGDAYQITHERTDPQGRFEIKALPHTYLITTDGNVANGGVNLDRPNYLSSHFKLEPGQDLTLTIKDSRRSAVIGDERACGYAQDYAGLNACLQQAERRSSGGVQDLFDQMVKSAPQSVQPDMRKAQSSWLQYRDEQCNVVIQLHPGSDMEKTSCRIRMNQARRQELEDSSATDGVENK
jgi:uncharacterized protein YecT (DUF1311 family)